MLRAWGRGLSVLLAGATLSVGVGGAIPAVGAQMAPVSGAVTTAATTTAPSPDAQAATGDSSQASTAADAGSAMAEAQRSGVPVEDLSQRTASSQTFAQPDGTWQTQIASEPVRVHNPDGSWSPIDTTLVHTTDGDWAPRASPADVVFSDGGTAPFVTMNTTGDSSFALAWPDPLPEPVVNDSTLTYPNVVPNGDLVVEALPGGFSHRIVLHRAPDGPVDYPIPLQLDGVELVEQPSGGLSVQTPAGREVASAPAPVMWDQTTTAAGEPQTVTPLGMSLDGTVTDAQLVLTPDTDVLHDPNTRYPIVIDPTFNAFRDTWVQTPDFTSSQVGSAELRAGTFDGGGHKARSFLDFNTDTLTGKQILTATMKARNFDAANCTASPIRVNAISQTWDKNTLTWGNQPDVYPGSYDEFTTAFGAPNCPTAGWAKWDLTAIVTKWATPQDTTGHWDNNGVRIKALDETVNASWRRYRSANYTDTTLRPELSVTYNNIPTLPASSLTVAPCVGTCSPAVTSSLTPTLSATATDADGDTLTYDFQVRAAGTTPVLASGTVTGVTENTRASWTVPAGTLTDATDYQYRVQASDANTTSTWSTWQGFGVDVDQPPSTPDHLGVAPCVGVCSDTITDSLTPTLSGTATDTDSSQLTYRFQVRPAAQTQTIADQSLPTAVSQGDTATWTVPDGVLVNDTSYQFRVGAKDATTLTWSTWRPFTVDLEGNQNGPTSVADGSLASSQTWGPEGSPYVIDGTVTVKQGQTLTMLPGTVVKFFPQTERASPQQFNFSGMNISGGRLVADGTASQPIVFTSYHDDTVGGNTDGAGRAPARGDWYQLWFSDGIDPAIDTPVSIMDNVSIRYGGDGSNIALCQGYGAVKVPSDGRVRITSSEFVHNRTSLNVSSPTAGGGGFSVSNSRFATSDCGMWAGRGDVRNNVFEDTNTRPVYSNGADDLRFYGNWVYGESDFTQGTVGVTRDEVDVRDNALLGGVEWNHPASQLHHDLAYNWWGPNPAQPSGCFDTTKTYIPMVTHNSGDTACAAAPAAQYITGYFTKVTPMLGQAPPLPEAGLGANPYKFLNVPDAQTLGDPGSGSEFGYRPTGTQADPVNSATGSYVDQVTDASVASLGLPLEATRTYNSADTTAGSLGKGWAFGYDLHLSFPTTNQTVFTAGDGQQLEFTQQADGTWAGGTGTTAALAHNSDGTWKLTTRAQMKYTFDTTGKVVSVLDRNNQGVTFTYDTTGKLSKATSAGRSLTFTYSGELLQRVTMPNNTYAEYGYTNGELTSVRDLAGATTLYGYDTSGRLTSETDPLGVQVMRLAYDPTTGRVSDQWDALDNHTSFGWDSVEQVATMTDPRGGTWLDDYAGNVLTSRTDPLGRMTYYEYDNHLQLIALTNPRGVRSTFSYNDAGDMTSTTGPLGTVTTTYNNLHDPVTTINAKGTTTDFGYDTTGNLTSLTTIPANPADPTLTQTYTVDARGLVTTATDAAGKTTTYTYNTKGDLTKVTTPEGRATSYTYGPLGRLSTSVDPRGNVTGADPAAFTTTYTYTPTGQTDTVTDPLGHRVDYDYDAAGQLKSSTDPKNCVTTYGYDNAGHVLSVQGPDPSVPAATATYDANGNVKTSTDPAGRTISYGYDLANQPTTATGPLGTYALGYDKSGNLASITNPNNQTTALSYSSANLLAKIDYPDTTPDVTYTNDTSGNRASMTDGAGTVTYTYDSLDRLTKVTRGAGTSANTFTYAYNNLGLLSATTNPVGRSFNYGYDDDGLLNTVTDTAANTTLATYGYNPDGAPQTGTLADGSTWTRSYDNAGRLTGLSDVAADGTKLLDDTYTLDPTGNPTNIGHADGTTDTYTYDTLDRLTGVCYHTTTCDGATDYIRWAYNAADNRTSETRPTGTTTYDYNPTTGLLASVTKPSGATTSYTYDALGRMTSDGSGAAYSYNLADRLTKIDKPGTTEDITYTYDGDGRRLKTTAGTSTTNFWWDPRSYQLVGETDGNAAMIRSYAYGLGRISSATGAGTSSYLHTDAQGSVRTITDATGAIDWRRDYEPYGVLRSSQQVDPTAPANPIGFAGEYTDPSGSSHLRARQYDPTIGAFTTPDPAGATTWSATTSYANANPMAFADPYGLFGLPSFGVVVDVVNDWGPTVTTVLGVGSLAFPPLAPVAAGAAAITAAASAYTAYDTCTNGAKGACGGAILDAAINTAAAVPGGSAVIPGVRTAARGVLGRVGAGVARTAEKAETRLASRLAMRNERGAVSFGRGSSGRTTPANLTEQLAMEQAMSNPAAGMRLPLKKAMSDPRWPADEGWVKMSQNVNGVEIHYVRNTTTGAVDDFKFVD